MWKVKAMLPIRIDAKKNKYSAIRVEGLWHGELVMFDSVKEAKCAAELQLLEKAGEISDLYRQRPIEILVARKDRKERPLIYIADFDWVVRVKGPTYGSWIVCDCKGMKTAVYQLKKRLLSQLLGIEIKEL